MNKWIDIALQNGVKDIVYENPYHRFPIIKVLAAKFLRELDLSNCDMMHVSESSRAANSHSLRKLYLSYVWLNENVLQALLNSCPLIVSLVLKSCKGLGKIELLNLQKIKSISIKTTTNKHVKIEAPTLEHLSFSNYSSKNLNVVECKNLKYLELNKVEIPDGLLDNLISKSQFLEVLKIQYRSGIRDIDSSNLVSLEYIGNQIPQLEMTSESSLLKLSKIFLYHNNYIDAEWFRKLRNFLSNVTSLPRWQLLKACDKQMDFEPNSTSKASLRGEDCPRPYKEIKDPLTHRCGTPTTPARPGLDIWSMDNIRRGPNNRNNELGEPDSDTMIQKWILGLTQPEKLAHEGRIVQDHIRRPITHPFSNVGYLTLLRTPRPR
ncbi:hypothetical protein CQW23_28988 [Capsicum baccatum]|uniref:F-box/LRR-repeat protein 15/At3g58940/PEG3-like LRR domain-containing protein n=1 Tax=Capsicum baccatum TaxID=33114 RepID=A0A2G2VI19_CAPBA|nr:hypothetical protein CQW23_28988 [Capsicum baccatum]